MKGSRTTSEQMQKEKLQSAEEQGEAFNQAVGQLSNKMMVQGLTPKDAMGFSSGYMENVYAQAYRLYNTGKYAEATHLFRILIMLNAMEPKYILGLGASLHMLKEYYDAIQTYTMCAVLDPTNPIPHYHSSDCFIQMKDYLSAMLCLELVIDKASNKAEYAKMKERAQLSLDSLKKQLGSLPAGSEAAENEQTKSGPIDLL